MPKNVPRMSGLGAPMLPRQECPNIGGPLFPGATIKRCLGGMVRNTVTSTGSSLPIWQSNLCRFLCKSPWFLALHCTYTHETAEKHGSGNGYDEDRARGACCVMLKAD